MAQKKITFGIGFSSDMTGLNQIRKSLEEMSNMSFADAKKIGITNDELIRARNTLTDLSAILAKSYDFKLNTLNVTKLNQELKGANLNIRDVQSTFEKFGAAGSQAFMNLTAGIVTSKKELKETKTFLDSMAQTFINTIKWSIASSAINNVTGAIQKAYSFSKQLDESLNDIRIVTGKSADEMDRFAVRANKAAAALGKTTRDYTTASLLFYQQGLNDRDVAARTNVTLKAANVTGQSTSEVSEQLTAIWNGYKVSAQEAETYIDKVAAVAATTASNLEELSEGMSKVAAAANNMGVDIDQLNAQLSTIISVTRQDAGVAGTALKTIYARMTDIEAGLDTETTLGNYTAEMAKFGIQVLDAKGGLRDVGDVMDEIGSKWTTFTREQQVALAQAMAGTRQYNNLIALFGNWDMYTKSLETSRGAMGTLQNQQDIYMESLEAHLNKLTASTENLYNALFDTKGFKVLIDIFSNVTNFFGDTVKNMGGIIPLVSLLLTLLNRGGAITNKIAAEISSYTERRQASKTANEEFAISLENINQLLDESSNNLENQENQLAKYTQEIAKAGQAILQMQKDGLISPQEAEDAKQRIENMQNYGNQIAEIIKKRQSLQNSFKEQTGKDLSLGKIEEESRSDTEAYNIVGANNYFKTQYESNVAKAYKERQKLIANEEELTKQKEDADARRKLGRAAASELSKLDAQRDANGNLNQFQQERYNYWQAALDDMPAAEKEFRSASSRLGAITKQRNREGYTDEQITAAYRHDFIQRSQGQAGGADGIEELAANLTGEHGESAVDLSAFAGTELGTFIDQYIQLKQVIEEASEGFDKQVKLFDDMQVGAEYTTQDIEDLSAAFAHNIEATQDMVNNESVTDAQKEQLADAEAAYQKFLQNKSKENGKFTQADISELKKLKLNYQKAYNSIEQTVKNSLDEQANGVVDAMNLEQEKAEQAMRNAKAEAEAFQKLTEHRQKIQDGMKTAQDIMSLTGAIMSLKNATDVLMDSEASWQDKLKTLGSTLLATIPILMNNNVIKQASDAISKRLIKTKLKEAGASATVATGEQVETGAHVSNTGAMVGETGAAIGLNIALGPLLLIMLAIAAAAVALAVAFKITTSLINRNADALKKAQENADTAAEGYDNVKNSYEELKASIEDYHTAQDAIKEMTAGTEEWKNAIQDANMQVMDLITKYAELADYVEDSTEVDGLKVINEEGLKVLEERKRIETQNAQANKLAAQSALRAQQERDNAYKLRQEMGYGNTAIGWGTAGAIVFGSGIVGATAVNAAIEDEYVDKVQNAIEKLAEQENAEYMLRQQSAAEIAEQLGITKHLADMLKDNVDAVLENTRAVKANSAIDKQANAQIMGAYMAEHGGSAYEDSNVQSTINNLLGERYASILEEQKAKFKDGGSAKLKDIDAQKEYARQMGYRWVKDNDGNKGTYARQDENGNWVEFQVDDSIAREAYATAEAQRIAAAGFNLNGINKIANVMGYSSSANSLAGRSRNALMGLAGKGAGATTSFENLSRKELAQLVEATKNLDLSAEELASFGFENRASFNAAIEQSAKNYKDIQENLINRLTDESTQERLRNLLTGDGALSQAWDEVQLKAQENFVKTLDVLSTEQADTVFKFIDKAGENAAGAIKAIADEVDWSAFDATDQFRKALVNSGVNLNDSNLSALADDLGYAISSVQESFGQIDGKKLNEAVKAIDSVVSSIKNIGDTIDIETYNKLPQQLQSLFSLNESGVMASNINGAAFASRAAQLRNSIISNTITDASTAWNKVKNAETAAKEEINNIEATDRANTIRINAELQTQAQGFIMTADKGAAEEKKKYAKFNNPEGLASLLNKAIENGTIDPKSFNSYTYDGKKRVTIPGLANAINDLIDNKDKNGNITGQVYYDNAVVIQKALDQIKNQSMTETDINAYISSETTRIEQESRKNIDKLTAEASESLPTMIGSAKTVEDLKKIEQELSDEQLNQKYDDSEITYKALIENQKAALKLKEIQFNQDSAEQKRTNLAWQYNNILDKESSNLEKLQKQNELLYQTESDRTNNLNDQVASLQASHDANKALLDQAKNINDENITAWKNQVEMSNLTGSEFSVTIGDEKYTWTDILTNVQNGKISYADAIDAMRTALFNAGYSLESIETTMSGFIPLLQTGLTAIKDVTEAESKFIESGAALAEKQIDKAYRKFKELSEIAEIVQSYNEFARSLEQDNYGLITNTYLSDFQINSMAIAELQNKMSDNQNELNELLNKINRTEEDNIKIQDLKVSLGERLQELQSLTLSAQEALTSIAQTRLDLAAAISDEYAKQANYLDAMRASLNHHISLMKMIKGENFYNAEVSGDILSRTQSIQELRENQAAAMEAAYKAAIGTELEQEALENWLSALKEYESALEDTMEAVQDKFEAVIHSAFQSFTNELAGGEWAAAADKWNWQYEFENQYLSGLEREMEISNVAIDFRKAINNTADIKHQQQLATIYQQQLDILEQKNRITKTDIDLAEKRLAVEQARIALENAQNDTSKMRLTRGADGSYSYQYVADEDNILDKMKAYNSARQELQQLERSHVNDIVSAIANIEELFAKLQETTSQEEFDEIWGRISTAVGALQDMSIGTDLNKLIDINSPLAQMIQNISDGTFEDALAKAKDKILDSAGKTWELTEKIQQASEKAQDSVGKAVDSGLALSETKVKELKDQVDDIDKNLKDTYETLKNTFDTLKNNSLIIAQNFMAAAAAMNGINLNDFGLKVDIDSDTDAVKVNTIGLAGVANGESAIGGLKDLAYSLPEFQLINTVVDNLTGIIDKLPSNKTVITFNGDMTFPNVDLNRLENMLTDTANQALIRNGQDGFGQSYIPIVEPPVRPASSIFNFK